MLFLKAMFELFAILFDGYIQLMRKSAPITLYMTGLLIASFASLFLSGTLTWPLVILGIGLMFLGIGISFRKIIDEDQ